jgi:hypothetical protein
VDQEQKTRERSFVSELVPDWRPSREQVLWATRLTVAAVLALIVVALLGTGLWMLLGIYIDPQNATERKDLAQSFTVVAAGLVGSLSALAAVGNLYVSRRNLQQQQELELLRARNQRGLEEQRAQDSALTAYVDQMVQLLNDTDRPLRQSQEGDEVRILTVLSRLDGGRKGSVVRFLYESGLITQDRRIVDLNGADLSEAWLSQANLSEATVSDKQLVAAKSLKGATMLNGQKYEDWLKDKEGSREDRENSGPP